TFRPVRYAPRRASFLAGSFLPSFMMVHLASIRLAGLYRAENKSRSFPNLGSKSLSPTEMPKTGRRYVVSKSNSAIGLCFLLGLFAQSLRFGGRHSDQRRGDDVLQRRD